MNSKLINVMIVGAGEAGQILVREIDNNRSKINRRVVVLVDDNKDIIGKDLLGIPVRGGVDEIKQIAGEFHVDEIIFSIANIKNSRKKEILDICRSTGLRTRTIPAMVDIIDCNVDIKTIRNVEIDDLLGREAVTLDIEKISGYLKDRTIMVTGGGGTIGSELCRQVANYNPKKLIILDNYENNAYSVEQELKIKYKNKLDIEVVIANIREEKRLDYVFEKYRPEILFHAAAHKHVPLMEFNKTEAVKNNIFGSLNLIKAADKYKVSRFVLISSDKAVNPTNIMVQLRGLLK